MRWLDFDGRVTRTTDGWRLRPSDDPEITIDMATEDVRIEHGTVQVRQHSRALALVVPPTSPAKFGAAPAQSPECPGGVSRCLGGLLYCCDNEVVGTCNGFWDNCPH